MIFDDSKTTCNDSKMIYYNSKMNCGNIQAFATIGLYVDVGEPVQQGRVRGSVLPNGQQRKDAL